MSLRSVSISWLALALLGVLEGTRSTASEVRVRPPSSPAVWKAERLSSRRDATALAVSPDGARLAFATPSGVWVQPLGAASEEPRRVFLRDGEVRALRFASDHTLWIGTDRGLYAIDGEGRDADHSPAPGSGREIRRFAESGSGCAFVATGRGVFQAQGPDRWRDLNGQVPDQEVTAVACDAAGELWLVSAGDLYEVVLKSSEHQVNSEVVRRHSLPAVLEPVVDLAASERAGDDLWALTTRRLLHRPDAGSWQAVDLPLAPGVEARRILRAGQVAWLAADRGLYVADGAAGPWRLADESLAGESFSALARQGEALFAAGERGVVRLVPSSVQAAPQRIAAPLPRELPRDPGRAALQRAVLSYLELDRGPGRSLAARARARGWLPVFEVRGAYGGARRRDLDYDQTFSSGEDRLFLDRDRSRSRDFDVAAVLRWDLGDTVFHPEELDVAKERREVIELRDEVLDEVHRLYFERQRVLLAWAALGRSDASESRALALRADELAAGLDAWSGGWWSAQVPSVFSPRLDLESTK